MLFYHLLRRPVLNKKDGENSVNFKATQNELNIGTFQKLKQLL